MSNGDAQGHGPLAGAIAQVLSATGDVVGAGFLVGPDILATCAHVAAFATEADPEAAAAPAGTLRVGFPLATDQHGRRTPVQIAATVESWWPINPDGTGDVALLRLAEQAPRPARVPPLRRVGEPWGHRFRVLGFPEEMQDGVWTSGELRDSQGTGWVQLEADRDGQPLSEGFSGSAVWDADVRAVVGMTVAAAARPGQTTAYLVPIEQVLGLDPDILPNPYRGLEAFQEEHADFYCGRGTDVERLVAAVRRRHLVAVAGRSGAGKSSLVMAGLIPRLRQDGYRIRELRPTPSVPPRKALALLLVTVICSQSSLAEQVAKAGQIEDALSSGPEAISSVVADLHEATGPDGLLVFVDQLEEIAADDPASAQELSRLLAQLAGPPPGAPAGSWPGRSTGTSGGTPAAEAGSGDSNEPGVPETTGIPVAPRSGDRGVHVVLTLRWDTCDELLTGDTADLLDNGTVSVAPMTRTQLREAIDGPATRAPGVYFEPGLVERILDNAGAEPGSLPLMESLLTQLWERHEGGYLTQAAYDDIGGVAGAVARHAERTLAAVTSQVELPSLRQLLTSFARLADDDQFVRRQMPLAELTTEQQELVQRLATHRLVVIGQDAHGASFAELAHQALIDHWPRLRSWLLADRDFLLWHQQLDRQVAEWEESGHDHGALLRRGSLARAQDWLADRGEQISSTGRAFIAASTYRQRRDARRGRALTAAFAALALIAGTLSVLAYSSSRDAGQKNEQLTAQLSKAHADTLGEQAQAKINTDTSTQLALAAWSADPTNQEARTALGSAYLATLSAEKIFSNVSNEPFDNFSMSDDGRVMIVPHSDGARVLTGIRGGHAKGRVLPKTENLRRAEISSDGRYVAGIDTDGVVKLWNLRRGNGPRRIDKINLPEDSTNAAGSQSRPWSSKPEPVFAPDSSRLLVAEPRGEQESRLRVWDLPSGDRVSHQLSTPGVYPFANIWQTKDPDRILIRHGSRASSDRWFEVRSLSTGAQIFSFPGDATPVRHGTQLMYCENQPGEATGSSIKIINADDGTPTGTPFTFPEPCGDDSTPPVWISRDTSHLLSMNSPGGTQNALLSVYSLHDGTRSTVSTPPPAERLRRQSSSPNGNPFVLSLGIGVFDQKGDRPGIYMAQSRSLFRFSGTPPVAPYDVNAPGYTDDGRYLVAEQEDDFEVRRTDTDEIVGELDRDEASGDAGPSDTATSVHGSHLVVTTRAERSGKGGKTKATVRVYSLPRLRREATVEVPGNTTKGENAPAIPAIALSGDTLMAVSGSTLSAWNLSDGQPAGTPVNLATNTQEARWLRQHIGNGNADVFAVPRQPDRITIPRADGTVEVWDAAHGRRIALMPKRINTGQYGTASHQQYAVDPTGTYLAFINEGGQVESWNLRTNRSAGTPIAVGSPRTVVGFTTPQNLVVSYGDGEQYSVWNVGHGAQVGPFQPAELPGSDRQVFNAAGLTIGNSATTPLKFTLDPKVWFRHLCAIQDRPFSNAERAELPQGVSRQRPCQAK